MKLHSEEYKSKNVINSYKENCININGISYTNNIFFSKNSKILKWDIVNFYDIDSNMLLEMLRSLKYHDKHHLKAIEFILIGAGNRYVSTDNFIINKLFNIGIGIEIMKTQSAIYTYNAMLMQDRNVLTALIIKN